MENISKQIGTVIRERREELGFSIMKTAKLAALTRRSIYQVESGEVNVTIPTLLRLCKVLDLSLSVKLEKMDSATNAT
jgi:predicted transcriptional regulator